jgi:hypothetical protein
MLICNRHVLSVPVSDSSLMEPFACLPAESLVSAFPVTTKDSDFMPLKATFIQSHELLFYNNQPQTPPQPEYICLADTVVTEEYIISIIGLTINDTSNAIYFLEKSDVVLSIDLYFSIKVPVGDMLPADCIWVVDQERALSFRITLFGMVFPVNNELQIKNSTILCNLRKRREHMGVGRMICLLNQHFIL